MSTILTIDTFDKEVNIEIWELRNKFPEKIEIQEPLHRSYGIPDVLHMQITINILDSAGLIGFLKLLFDVIKSVGDKNQKNTSAEIKESEFKIEIGDYLKIYKSDKHLKIKDDGD